MSFSKTKAQTEAVRLLCGDATHILLFGGSRSGKTFILVRSVVIRALRAAGSRHCILRKHFTDLNKSIVCDTFPAVMEKCFPEMPYALNKSLYFARFPNGSEIWFGGLDKGDKILGNEYATMYFNEISEISYDQVETAYSRNAQRCDGLVNRFYYDCNPPGKSHWSYKLFEDGVNPADNKAVLHPELYAHMRMNPVDNLENLSETYLQSLEMLSARKKARFLRGEWQESPSHPSGLETILKRASAVIDLLSPSHPSGLETRNIGTPWKLYRASPSHPSGLETAVEFRRVFVAPCLPPTLVD